MPSLDNTPQQLESPHHTTDNNQATGLSRQANNLHTPMSGSTGAAGGGSDTFSQKDVDAIHQGFDGTAALYGGHTAGSGSSSGDGRSGAQAANSADAPRQIYDGSAGRASGGADSQGTTYTMQDGSSLTLQSNNKAQVTDGNGQSQGYSYYANNDGNGWHTMYKDSQSPSAIADSMRQFRLAPEGGAGAGAGASGNPVQMTEPTYSAMHSSRLTPAERDFVAKNVPDGSKPIGMGIHRQAWQTPDNKAVVVGTNDHRPEAPFILAAEKTEVSGNKKAETFPLGENKSISKEDVDKFVKHWADKGWEMRDNKISNFARTSDGKMWRLDPDDVFNWNE